MNSLQQQNIKSNNNAMLIKENANMKPQIERLTLENTKYQNTIIKLQNKVKYYEDMFKQNECSVNNNINERCMNKKEFVQLWNDFGRPDMLNNFVDFENEPIIVFHLIQEMFYIVTQLVEEYEKSIYSTISRLLKFNNEHNFDIYGYLKHIMKQVFKDFHENIFQINHDDNNMCINDNKCCSWFSYKEFFKKYIEFFEKKLKHNESHTKVFYDVIKSSDFIKMLEHVKRIVLFLKFNGMQYNLHLEPFNERVMEIRDNMHNKKMNYVIPFGYSKDNSYGIVLLHPPVHKKICSCLYDKNIPPIVFGISSEYIEQNLQNEKYIIKNLEQTARDKATLNVTNKPLNVIGSSQREKDNNNKLCNDLNNTKYNPNQVDNTISTLRSSNKTKCYLSLNKHVISPDPHKTPSINKNNSHARFQPHMNQNVSTNSGDSNTCLNDFKYNPIFHKSAGNFLQSGTKDNSLSNNNSLNSNEHSHSKTSKIIKYTCQTKKHYTKQNTNITEIEKLLGKDGKVIKTSNGQMIVKVKGKKRENSIYSYNNITNLTNTPSTPNGNKSNFSLNGKGYSQNANFLSTKSNTIATEENEQLLNSSSNMKHSMSSNKKQHINNSNKSIYNNQNKLSYMKKQPINGFTNNNSKNIIGSNTNINPHFKKKNIISIHHPNTYLRKK